MLVAMLRQQVGERQASGFADVAGQVVMVHGDFFFGRAARIFHPWLPHLRQLREHVLVLHALRVALPAGEMDA